MTTLQDQIALATAKATGQEVPKEAPASAEALKSVEDEIVAMEEYSPAKGDYKLARLKRIVPASGRAVNVNAHGYIPQPKGEVKEFLDYLVSVGEASVVE
jgi:hypothetical protein